MLLIPAAALALAGCNKANQTTSAAAPAAAPPVAGPVGMPTPKAGLWTQTISHDGKVLAAAQTRMCVDVATGTNMMNWSQRAHKIDCQQQAVNRGLDGSVTVESTCPMPTGGTMSSKTVLSGDFAAKYHVRIETSATGAPVESMNGQHLTEIDAVYGGPCPPDMGPGDVIMANGMKFSASKMAGGGAAPAPGGPAAAGQ
jgi:hypothetical protein